jgi:hypothetical protein
MNAAGALCLRGRTICLRISTPTPVLDLTEGVNSD